MSLQSEVKTVRSLGLGLTTHWGFVNVEDETLYEPLTESPSILREGFYTWLTQKGLRRSWKIRCRHGTHIRTEESVQHSKDSPTSTFLKCDMSRNGVTNREPSMDYIVINKNRKQGLMSFPRELPSLLRTMGHRSSLRTTTSLSTNHVSSKGSGSGTRSSRKRNPWGGTSSKVSEKSLCTS